MQNVQDASAGASTPEPQKNWLQKPSGMKSRKALALWRRCHVIRLATTTLSLTRTEPLAPKP